MAIRKIRLEGDPVLGKKCRPVEVMTDKLHVLIGDMLDTMYEHNGVGLAAPQVGILKRMGRSSLSIRRSWNPKGKRSWTRAV